MNESGRFSKLFLASTLAVSAVYLLQGLARKPGWRGNVAWVIHSWWRPADREAHWQQAAGDFVDPWDKLVHARGAGRRGGSRPSQPASSMGR
jgi:hypothetical protein